MPESVENKGRVLLGFILEGEDPDAVTRILGIEPDSVLHEDGRHVSRYPDGSIHEHTMSTTGIPAQWFSWGGWKECGSVQVQLEHWCERLRDKREAVSSILATGAYGGLTCCCEVEEEESPTFILPAALLEDIARLGLDLNVSFLPPYEPPKERDALDS